MPAKSQVQQQLMGADYARAKAGKPTRTGMGMTALRDYASTSHAGLPKRKRRKRRKR